jgi:hypothetical protein
VTLEIVRVWHAYRTNPPEAASRRDDHEREKCPDLGWSGGAGDENRTRMTSLEGWGSTIELRPHGG